MSHKLNWSLAIGAWSFISMSFLSKKIIAIITLCILVAFSVLPVFAAAVEPPFECWPKDVCKDNWAQTATSKTNCGPFEKDYGKPLGFCYAKPPTVNLQVKIGGANTVAGLTDYIPKIYNYLLSIVSIVAIIMIMIGGLRYLTAGGNPSAIGAAKETILGAIIGLFLVLGSYLLLQTINPALVNLKLPDIKMIRTSALVDKKELCASGRGNVNLGNECKNTCECKQGKCIPLEPGALELFVQATGGTVAVATSIWSFGTVNVVSGGKLLVAVKEGAKFVAKAAGKYPITTTAGGVGLLSVVMGGDGEAGVCIIEADRNVPTGDWCEKDSHCISGKCIVSPNLTGLSVITGAKGFGVCADGKNTSSCECAETGVCAGTGGCNAGLWCVDNSDGKYTKSCTDGKAESPCYSNNDCKVAGFTCQMLKETKRCLSVSEVNYNTACTTHVACANAGSAWSCVKGFCSDGRDGGNCDVFAASQGNPGACSGNYTCAFYSNTQASRAQLEWVENTGNKNDYPEPYQSEWETESNKPHGFQCKPSDFYVPVSKLKP